MDKISIIIPCFNEEEALPIYYDEMKKVMDIMKKQSDFELIFVDDGSSDRTYEILKDYTERTEDVSTFPFPETLEKKLQSMQDFKMQAVIMRQSWM